MGQGYRSSLMLTVALCQLGHHQIPDPVDALGHLGRFPLAAHLNRKENKKGKYNYLSGACPWTRRAARTSRLL